MADKPTQEQAKVLKELAPFLETMAGLYQDAVDTLVQDGKTVEEASEPAALYAIMGGLTMSRGEEEITEKVTNLIFAKEIFKKFVGVNHLFQLGLVEGEMIGKDEYDWPMYRIDKTAEVEL